jgi:hypothetical protein
MMKKNHLLHKTIVLSIISLFLWLSIFTATSTSIITSSSAQKSTISQTTAYQVAEMKIQELSTKDFTIRDTIVLKNNKETMLCYIFSLNPQGYMVISASFDLPPLIAYSFSNNYQDSAQSNILSDLLKADLSLRLENIQKIPKELLEQRHLQWTELISEKPLVSTSFEQWPPEGSTSTGGWVETLRRPLFK